MSRTFHEMEERPITICTSTPWKFLALASPSDSGIVVFLGLGWEWGWREVQDRE